MGHFCRTASRYLLAVLLLSLFGPPCRAAEVGYYLEILAESAEKAFTKTGHAFMVLSRDGREYSFGFFPVEDTNVFIGGPGFLEKEFNRDVVRVPGLSVKQEITREQYDAIRGVVRAFNMHPYRLLKLTNSSSNCIDFVDQVAKVAGWRTPLRTPLQRPSEYVALLKEMNMAFEPPYTVRVFNADDRVVVRWNGRPISEVGFMKDSGRMPLRPQPGSNTLELILFNEVKDSTSAWSYEVLRGGKVLHSKYCGNVVPGGVTGCFGRSDVGEVTRVTYVLPGKPQ